MPMLDVQKAHLEVFRVRFGEFADGKPSRLTDAMRVTSENPAIVDAFTEAYGGERRPWDKTKWEAYLPITELSVVLLPGQSITQWWEKYKGSVCERRCDGQVEQKSGKPCSEMKGPTCDPDPERRTKNKKDCTPTTRVNVICPDVKVAGSGMFVCHGLIGAKTLPRAVATAEAALRAGIYVPATVRVVEMVGAGTKWIVPKIEIVGVSLEDMIEAASTQEAIGSGRGRILGVSTGNGNGGAPAIEAPSTLRGQFDANGQPAQQSTRKNAAEPIATSGLAPRTAADAGMEEIDGDEIEEAEIVGDGPRPSSPAGEAPAAPAQQAAGASRPVNRVAIAAREAGLDDDGRHDLSEWASAGRTRSSAALSDVEQTRAIEGAGEIQKGHARLVRNDDGEMLLKDTRFGWPAGGDPVTGSTDPVTVEGVVPSWEEVRAMKGPDLVAALRDLGLQVGGKVPEMQDRLAGHYGLGEESF